jgi:hypothetical protein
MLLPSKMRLPVVALALLACAAPALAALGQGAQSVRADGQLLGAPHRLALVQGSAASAASAAATITTQVVRTPQGVTVTEYMNGAGTVFGLAWHGPVKPDLRQLLGGYFSRYLASAGAGSGGLASAQAVGNDLVVRSAGSMQGFVGTAYVPSLVPAGFSVTQLQP